MTSEPWSKTPHAVARNPNLSPGSKAVLSAIRSYSRCDHDSDDWEWCDPSYASLTDCTGLCRRTVYDHVRELERQGFLEVEHRPGRRTRYRPVIPELSTTRAARRMGTRAVRRTGQGVSENGTRAARRTGPVQSAAPDPCSQLHPKKKVDKKKTASTHPPSTKSDSPEGVENSDRDTVHPKLVGSVIHEHLHLGKKDSRWSSMDREVSGFFLLSRSRGIPPNELLGTLQHVRGVLEGDLRDEPVGIAMLIAHNAILQQAHAAYLKTLPVSDIAKEVAHGQSNV